MKHKRGDLLGEIKQLAEIINRRERVLLFHSFMSIIILIPVWVIYIAINEFAPAIPIAITVVLVLFYLTHYQYVKSQNRHSEKLMNAFITMIGQGPEKSEAFVEDYQRLLDQSADNEDYYQQDSTYYQNSNS